MNTSMSNWNLIEILLWLECQNILSISVLLILCSIVVKIRIVLAVFELIWSIGYWFEIGQMDLKLMSVQVFGMYWKNRTCWKTTQGLAMKKSPISKAARLRPIGCQDLKSSAQQTSSKWIRRWPRCILGTIAPTFLFLLTCSESYSCFFSKYDHKCQVKVADNLQVQSAHYNINCLVTNWLY